MTKRGHGQDDEAERLLDSIRALVRRFAVNERADVSCEGMTIAQSVTLEVLAVEGPLRLGDLGKRLGISPSTLTRNLARLEARAFIERTADEYDARATVVGLTAPGKRAAAAVRKNEIAFARQILERVPRARRGGVVESLRDLLVAVRAATESCCPGAFDHLMKGFPAVESEGGGEGPETIDGPSKLGPYRVRATDTP
jgi:DNA-binding MarR family transcriptional regulator